MVGHLTTPIPDGTQVGFELIGGVNVPWNIICDTAGADAMGLAAASPDPLTLLGRLKAIVTSLTALPSAIASALTGLPVTGTFFPATQPVSAVSLPLPTGAATEASLASVLAKLSADPATQTTLAAVLAKLSADPATQTTLAAVLTKLNASIAITAAGLPLPTGAATEATLLKLPVAQGAAISGQFGAMVQGSVSTAAPSYTNGQVAPLSLDPSGALRITGTLTAGGLAQGSATSGQQGGLQMGAVTTAPPTYTTGQTSPLSLTTGGSLRVEITNANTNDRKAATGSAPVVSCTEDKAVFDAIAASVAGATPAGSAIIGKVGIDQTTDGTSNKVNIDASLKSGTATRSTVNSGTTSVTILAANANRKGGTIFNSDANALLLDLSGGTAAATRCQQRLVQYASYEIGAGYTGAITGIWEADGSGVADITENT